MKLRCEKKDVSQCWASRANDNYEGCRALSTSDRSENAYIFNFVRTTSESEFAVLNESFNLISYPLTSDLHWCTYVDLRVVHSYIFMMRWFRHRYCPEAVLFGWWSYQPGLWNDCLKSMKRITLSNDRKMGVKGSHLKKIISSDRTSFSESSIPHTNAISQCLTFLSRHVLVILRLFSCTCRAFDMRIALCAIGRCEGFFLLYLMGDNYIINKKLYQTM